MAERRMFAKAVVLSDVFLDLPARVRCLYFLMAMTADDDGFVNSPKSMLRQCGAKAADLKLLEQQGFVICFDSGVVVIRHWLVHNQLRKDRYRGTTNREEKELLVIDDSRLYCLCTQSDGIPIGNQLATQDREEEERKEKVSIDYERVVEFKPPTLMEVAAYCRERTSPVSPRRFMDYYTANGWMLGKNKMLDWQAALRAWEEKEVKFCGSTSNYGRDKGWLTQEEWEDAEI